MFMAHESAIATVERIETGIRFIRGQRVMLDSDLAKIYGVSTKALNQAIKRNAERFPEDFAFQLTRQEFRALMSQSVTSKIGRGGRQKAPWVFGFHMREKARRYRISNEN